MPGYVMKRRETAALLAAPFFLPLAARARSRPRPTLTFIMMGDLHSGYAWSARLLAAVRHEVEAARSSDVRIVVNGDVFERNNAVACRNDGKIDLALIRAFAKLAPTIVTIGNHDSDLSIALVHAGFEADRKVLPLMKPPFVLHGSHDHLRFTQVLGRAAMHLQSGAWSNTSRCLPFAARPEVRSWRRVTYS